jgi:Phytanoyl-CoA dioxygenase (PhyH)
MQNLLDSFNRDGFVVLEDVIDPAHCDLLCEKMLADVTAILARPDVPFNFNKGNVQQAPPPFAPYLFEDVLFNEKIIEVTKAILGPGIKNNFYSGNTALPGEHFQPVHPDVAQLWQGLEHATPSFGIVINVPVVETHHDTRYFHGDGSARVSDEHLAAWRERHPPIQPTVKRGSVVIRDIRLWHAGMPNRTDQPRPMIAMIHWCGWFADWDGIEIPERSRSFFENKALHTNIKVIPDANFDHIKHGGAYDLQEEVS